MREKRVYFLRPVGQLGPVKIGCSCFPEGRLDTFTIWSPQRLELVTSVPGNHADERALHGMFKKHHLHGEWFAASKELLGLIEHCATTGALPDLPQVIAFPKTRHKAHTANRPARPNKRAWAAVMRAEYEAGANAAELGARHSVAPITALRMVKFAGGKVRTQGPEKGPQDIARAADMFARHQRGESLAAIGRHYGITRERVRQIIKSLGLKAPQHDLARQRIPLPVDR